MTRAKAKSAGKTLAPPFDRCVFVNAPFDQNYLPRFGARARRDFLLMAAEPHQDKITLSHMAGQDSKSHKNDRKTAVSATRAFLSAKADPGESTRGADAISKGFEGFRADLPRLAENLELTVDEIQSFDYLRDWMQAMAAWLLNPPHTGR